MRFKRDGKEYVAIKEICLTDGAIIGVFEGSRGANPDHDILIKYQENGKRLRTPKGAFVNNLTIYRGPLCGFIV